MNSFRVLVGLCFTVCAAGVAGVVVLSAFTSWWVLFALFAVPPLVMMAGGAAMVTAGGPFARICAGMPCASWFRGDIARVTPVR